MIKQSPENFDQKVLYFGSLIMNHFYLVFDMATLSIGVLPNDDSVKIRDKASASVFSKKAWSNVSSIAFALILAGSFITLISLSILAVFLIRRVKRKRKEKMTQKQEI